MESVIDIVARVLVMNSNPIAGRHRSPMFWGAMIFVSMALIGAAAIFEVIDNRTAHLLMVVAMLTMIPLVRAANRQALEQGCSGPAIQRYTRGIAVTSFLYVAGLGLGMFLFKNLHLGIAATALVAMLPVLPTLAMIGVMGRYLREETDEYLRHRAVMAALVGLGFVLVLGSFWGFLETFGVAPHVWAWWVMPVWAIGMGAGQVWMRVRGA
jgi:hypothetical protein